jgi:hypothetical protein
MLNLEHFVRFNTIWIHPILYSNVHFKCIYIAPFNEIASQCNIIRGGWKLLCFRQLTPIVIQWRYKHSMIFFTLQLWCRYWEKIGGIWKVDCSVGNQGVWFFHDISLHESASTSFLFTMLLFHLITQYSEEI